MKITDERKKNFKKHASINVEEEREYSKKQICKPVTPKDASAAILPVKIIEKSLAKKIIVEADIHKK